ncbi:MAG: GDP-mannose 4,6-dehydratase [Parvibaculum sp.]|nr:GDP-mannose 4,6-dehydratase [Parvibaculum sp.]
MNKRALIFGLCGQDGVYLAKLLSDQGYEVHGTSRDKEMANTSGLRRIGVLDDVTIHSAALLDFRSVLQVIDDVRPDEIYNLAGQSSVGLSFVQPVETFEGIILGTLNILECIRFLKLPARFYNATSGEVFGNTEKPANETMPFQPRSPYGVAKSTAFWTVANYRESYGIFACSGILFNHESPLRPSRFVTQKIVRGAVDIAQKKTDQLTLGNLDVSRDWGWAPEYVDAMARMLRQDAPDDYVVATGVSSTLTGFVEAVFDCLGLRWRAHVETAAELMRPTDIRVSVGDPARAKAKLGWSASTKMPHIVNRLVDAELERRAGKADLRAAQ